uniref:Uncharacterized protein n=1 Tax=Plectus sambesii TaxID=2011161 RepID=A0A914UHJ4_9BILA
MDEESLERIMRFQANKIGMLERDVRAMTTRFGRKERALMSEVTALHRRLRVQSDELAANLALFDAVNRKAGADKDGITATSKDGHCQVLFHSVLIIIGYGGIGRSELLSRLAF